MFNDFKVYVTNLHTDLEEMEELGIKKILSPYEYIYAGLLQKDINYIIYGTDSPIHIIILPHTLEFLIAQHKEYYYYVMMILNNKKEQLYTPTHGTPLFNVYNNIKPTILKIGGGNVHKIKNTQYKCKTTRINRKYKIKNTQYKCKTTRINRKYKIKKTRKK
jgi:hypothetical protein